MDAEIKVCSSGNLELPKSLSVKPGEGQNIALYASSAARNSACLMFAFRFHSTSFSLNALPER